MINGHQCGGNSNRQTGSKSKENAKTTNSNTLFVLSAEISLKPVRTYLLLLNIYLERFIFSAREDLRCSVLAAHKLQIK